MTASKMRLDRLLAERGLAPSRERARALILAGRVRVDGRRADKAGSSVPAGAAVRVLEDPNPYVSRGGMKLAAALRGFGIDPRGWSVLDVGASTGGFTDCLLQAGARRVLAMDVGRGQLDWKLRQDPRVTVMEGLNARYLDQASLDQAAGARLPLQLAVVDVSFISLGLILPPLAALPGLPRALVLVKPQFEAGRREVRRGGVVRDPAVHARVLLQVRRAASACGWQVQGLLPSPIPGVEGNREFFLDLSRDPRAALSDAAFATAVKGAAGAAA